MDDIPEKSSGIFLWTYLVVRTIPNKTSHGLSDESLEAYLDSLPRGLEGLFAHVLDNLDTDNQKRTLRTIDLLNAANRCRLPLSLLAFSLWDDFEKDNGFSIRDNIRGARKDMRSLELQLRGTCGGLIESERQNKNTKILEFVHRSIPDMSYEKTQTPELGRRMDVALSGFDTMSALSHLSFGATRLSRDPSVLKSLAVVSIALMRLREMNDQPPYQFLEYLDTWMSDIWFESPQSNQIVFVKGTEEIYLVGATSPGGFSFQSFYSTICLAAFVGEKGYVDWKLTNDSNITDNPAKKALVAQSVLHSRSWECFFGSEVLNQPFTSNLIPFPGEEDIYPISADADVLTPWQYYIGQSIWVLQPAHWTRDPNQRGEVIGRFLEQGEDPFCQVEVEINRCTTACVVVSFRRATIRYSLEYSSLRPISHMLPEAIIDCQKGESRPEFEWGQQISKVFTLRELIAKAKWENRDRILELLDQNIERPSGRRTMSGRIYIIVLVFITCSAYFLLLLMI